MKKLGRILFCCVPFLLNIALQFLITIPLMGISLAYVINKVDVNTDINDFINTLTDMWASASFNTWVNLLFGIASLTVFFIWYQKRFPKLQFTNMTKRFNPLILISVVCLVIGLQHSISYLVELIAVLKPNWMDFYEQLMDTVDFSNASPILALYSVIIGPINEELIYRGITLGYAKREMPFWAANLLQAFLFGVMHMNMIQGIYAFLIGIIFGYICHKSSIYVAILLHILFNLWGTYMTSSYMSTDSVPLFLFWLALGIAFTIIGMLLFQSGVQRLENKAKDFGISSDI